MPNFIVDRVFPEGSIHLVAGPTGAGKSRWLLETMIAWAGGNDVLGFQSFPRPWVYISADRSERDVWNTVDSMGIARADVPLLPAFAPLLSVSQIFDRVEQRRAEVLVWEGFGGYVEDRANGNAVKRWLSTMTHMLEMGPTGPRSTPLTVIGVVEQPKMKPRDKYENPRQRISGPAAWGHSASTIVMVEHEEKAKARGPRRVLGVYPRDAADMEFKATLASGHFVVLP